MSEFDVLVIGAGHNGLTCAAYLARAGLTVKVLERRAVVGGAAVTEEFHPGFRNSVYSYAISLLQPKIIRDLELSKHGLQILEKPAGTLSLLADDCLQLTRDGDQIRREVARFSKRDAKRVHTFDDEIARVAIALRGIAMRRPPDVGGGWSDLWPLLKAGNTLRQLDAGDQAVLAELMTKSLGDYLDSWFEGEALKGLWGFEGVIGNFADPYQPGTAYVLLHHAFGEVNGKTGAWGIARGGMGAITQAMLSYAETKGVQVETSVGVSQVLVEKGKACGAVTGDGRKIRARVVAANLHPQTLLLKLLDPSLLDEATHRRIESYRSESGSFRMNLALSELPRFSHFKADDDFHFKGTVEVSPSLDYLSRAYSDAKTYGWSRNPVIALQIPSVQDDSLCAPGSHVASLFCQQFRRHLPDGRSWDDAKEVVADLIVDTLDQYAPNLKRSIVGRQIKSPLDIERDLGMVGGDIFHGSLHLDQLYSLRPVPRYSGYRMPVDGLYLCGSGAHPGGGVTGLPGHHAAARILGDRRRWSES